MAKRKLNSGDHPDSAHSSKRPKVQLQQPADVGASETEPPHTTHAPRVATMPDRASHPLPGNAPQGGAHSHRKRTKDREGEGSQPAARLAHKIHKLVPPRPFPTVPTSVSATGPRSAHSEGKNYICVTRRTKLGAYLRRCKDVILTDGHKTLHLSAMGAAIPHLMQLALSLPPILPFPQDEIHTEVLTGTVEVQDELIPDDDEEDVAYRTRGKSTLSVVIKIGDGVDEPVAPASKGRKNRLGRTAATSATPDGTKGVGKNARATEQLVYREDEMDDT